MAKSYLKINDFSGGMVDAIDARDLKPNQFARIENFMLDKRSSLVSIGGEVGHSDIPSGDEIVLCPGYGLFVYDTDHNKGDIDYNNARDDGEHWMAILDAINANIDLYNLNNDNVDSDVIDLGTTRRYNPGTNLNVSYIQVVAPSDTIIVQNCEVEAGSTTVIVPKTFSLKKDMYVTGARYYNSANAAYDGIVDGTKITEIGESNITIDTAAVTTHTGVSLYFSKTLKSDTIITTTANTNFKFPGGDDDWGFKNGDIINIGNFSDNTINNINALRIKNVSPAAYNSFDNKISGYVNSLFIDDSDWVAIGNGESFTDSSPGTEYLSVTGTSSTDPQGAKLGYSFLHGESSDDSLQLNKKYLVSAVIQHSSAPVDDYRFSLCGVKSHGFSIDTTGKRYSAVIDLSHDDATIDKGFRIFCENSNTSAWTIDNASVTPDGSIMVFDEPVLWRTDRITKYDTVLSTAPETGNVSLTLMPKVIYHFTDEALRICDTTLSTGTSEPLPPQIKWWGYIKRKQFNGATEGGNANRSIDGWSLSDNKLSAPTYLSITDGATPSYAGTAGAGWAVSITAATAGINSVFGTWLVGRYEFATTFIYDGNQESMLYVSTDTFDVGADNSDLTIKVTGKQEQSDVPNAIQYDSRISGGRVYFRESGTDDDWQVFLDIDIVKGVRAKPFGAFTAWTDGSTDEATSGIVYSFMPNIDTYETLNGYSQDEQQLYIGGTNEGYRTSLIANRRCFVANVKTAYSHPSEDSDPIHMRDRIMYSPMNRFDTFPRNFYIDVVKGDAEEYIKLEEYADRLLAFKQRRLHIINIQDSTPNNWFLEDIKDFAGIVHHSASVKTEFGICWVNEEGCFLYDGRGVKNLILGKIAETSWEDFVTNESSIFYNPKKFYVGVLSDYFGGNSGIYMYDFRTQSWTKGGSMLGSNQNRTNYVNDWNGNAMTAYQPLAESWQWNLCQETWEDLAINGDNSLYIWSNLQTKRLDPRQWGDDYTTRAIGTVLIQTKDYDFGEPGLIKKVYSVTITYASSTDMVTPVSYATDGGTSFTDFTGNFTGTGSGWKKLRATLSAPVECQSVAIKIKNTSPTGIVEGLKINDVSVEYRVLRKRVS